MINYTFQLTEMDAEPIQAPKQENEDEKEYTARLREAKGKHVFRVVVQDSDQQQFVSWSPYFDKHSEQQKWETMAQGMKGIKKAVVARERMKETMPKAEPKSALIVDGVELEMKRLSNRRKN